MQAKKRYILVFISCAFLAYCYFGGYRLKILRKSILPFNLIINNKNPNNLPSFIKNSNNNINNKHNGNNLIDKNDLITSHTQQLYESKLMNSDSNVNNNNKYRTCTMETCFDFTKCYNDFLVYIYPPEPLNSLGASPPISQNYQKIITAIQESRYYTTEPEKACLFVLGIDTLDRDSLSEDFVRNVPSRLQRLQYWNNGKNHIIFNLYSGTWPDYIESNLGFDPGQAILAKASMSIQSLRYNFDISIPLFHKQFPLRGGSTGFVQSNNFPANKKYLLAFKGKR